MIDETTPLTPALTRASDRIDANAPGLAWARHAALRSPSSASRESTGPAPMRWETLKAGRARRIVKPGQVFKPHPCRRSRRDRRQGDHAPRRRRIQRRDDEPTAPGDRSYSPPACSGRATPEIAFEEAKKTMSPFAISFYGESKRVRNDRIKSALGVSLRYPTIARACARSPRRCRPWIEAPLRPISMCTISGGTRFAPARSWCRARPR